MKHEDLLCKHAKLFLFDPSKSLCMDLSARSNLFYDKNRRNLEAKPKNGPFSRVYVAYPQLHYFNFVFF